jgi:hypothetical protein
VDGACLPCLASKMLSGEGSLQVLGGSVCHKYAGSPCKLVDYRYSRLTVCVVSPLREVSASNIICVTVSVTVTLGRNVVFQYTCVKSPILIPVLRCLGL